MKTNTKHVNRGHNIRDTPSPSGSVMIPKPKPKPKPKLLMAAAVQQQSMTASWYGASLGGSRCDTSKT
jgi:hypothetical protein